MTAEPLIDAFIQPANHPYFVKEKTFWTVDRAAAVTQKCRAANPFHSGHEVVPASQPSHGDVQHAALPTPTATSGLAGRAPLHALHRLPGRPTADDDVKTKTSEVGGGGGGSDGGGTRFHAAGAVSSSPGRWPQRSSYLSGSRTASATSAAAGESKTAGGGGGSLAFLTESIKRKKSRRQQQQPQAPVSTPVDSTCQPTKQRGYPTLPPLLPSGRAGFLNAAYEACHGDVPGTGHDLLGGDHRAVRDIERAAEASEDGDWDAGSGCDDGVVGDSGSGGGFAGWRVSSTAASDALSMSGSSCHEDDIQPVALILHIADDHCRGDSDDRSGAAAAASTGGGNGLPSLTKRWFSRQKQDGSGGGSGSGSGAGSLRYHRDSGRSSQAAQPFGRGAGGGAAGGGSCWADGTAAGSSGSSGSGCLPAGASCAGKPHSLSPSFGRLRSGKAGSRSRSRSPSNYSCSSSWLLPEHPAARPPPRSPSYGSVDSLTRVLPPIGAAGTSAGRRQLQQLQLQQESSFFDIVVSEPLAGAQARPPPPGGASVSVATARSSIVLRHLEQFDVAEDDDDDDDDGGGGGGGLGARRVRKRQRHHRRRRLLIAGALILVGMVAAGAIATYLLMAGEGEPAKSVVHDGGQSASSVLPGMTTLEPSSQLLPTLSKQTRFVGTVLLKIEYTPDMANLQSVAARNVTSQFCDTVKRIYSERNSTSNMVYDDCRVTQLVPGSVKVSFKITFNESIASIENKLDNSTKVEMVRKVLESEVSTSNFGTFPCDAKAITMEQEMVDEASLSSSSSSSTSSASPLASSAGNGSSMDLLAADLVAAISAAVRSNMSANKSEGGNARSTVANSTDSGLERLNISRVLPAVTTTATIATLETSSVYSSSDPSTVYAAVTASGTVMDAYSTYPAESSMRPTSQAVTTISGAEVTSHGRTVITTQLHPQQSQVPDQWHSTAAAALDHSSTSVDTALPTAAPSVRVETLSSSQDQSQVSTAATAAAAGITALTAITDPALAHASEPRGSEVATASHLPTPLELDGPASTVATYVAGVSLNGSTFVASGLATGSITAQLANGSIEPARPTQVVVVTDQLPTTAGPAMLSAAASSSAQSLLPTNSTEAAPRPSWNMTAVPTTALVPPQVATLPQTPVVAQTLMATQLQTVALPGATPSATYAADTTFAQLPETAVTQPPSSRPSEAAPSSSWSSPSTAASTRRVAVTTASPGGASMVQAGTPAPAPSRSAEEVTRLPTGLQLPSTTAQAATSAVWTTVLPTASPSSSMPRPASTLTYATRGSGSDGGGTSNMGTAAASLTSVAIMERLATAAAAAATASAPLVTADATTAVTATAAASSPVGHIVTPAAASAAAAMPCRPGEKGLRANATDCRAYYLCLNATTVHQSCLPGKYFSTHVNACVSCVPSECSLCAVSRSERAGDADSAVAVAAVPSMSVTLPPEPTAEGDSGGGSSHMLQSAATGWPPGEQAALSGAGGKQPLSSRQPVDSSTVSPRSLAATAAATAAAAAEAAPSTPPVASGFPLLAGASLTTQRMMPSRGAADSGTEGDALSTASPRSDGHATLAPATPRRTSASEPSTNQTLPSSSGAHATTLSARAPLSPVSRAPAAAATSSTPSSAAEVPLSQQQQQQPSMVTGRAAASLSAITAAGHRATSTTASAIPAAVTAAAAAAAARAPSASAWRGSSTPPADSAATPYAAAATQPSPTGALHLCVGKPGGLVADPTDCRKYMFCQSSGRPVESECDSHEMYSEAHNNTCVPCDVNVCALCSPSLVDRK